MIKSPLKTVVDNLRIQIKPGLALSVCLYEDDGQFKASCCLLNENKAEFFTCRGRTLRSVHNALADKYGEAYRSTIPPAPDLNFAMAVEADHQEHRPLKMHRYQASVWPSEKTEPSDRQPRGRHRSEIDQSSAGPFPIFLPVIAGRSDGPHHSNWRSGA